MSKSSLPAAPDAGGGAPAGGPALVDKPGTENNFLHRHETNLGQKIVLYTNMKQTAVKPLAW